MALLKDHLIAHYKMDENTAADNDELVTNGNFATDSNWSKGDGWSIAAGFASSNGSQAAASNLIQTIAIVNGRKYKITYTINNRTHGTIKPFIGSSGDGSSQSADGTYSEVIECAGTYPFVYIQASSTFVGDVDDVSIKLCAVEDSSGNDHDGLLQEDTSAAHVAGKIHGAFDFDGAADYIEIADHGDFTPALTPFSISAWVYMHDATNFIVASKGVEAIDGEWRFYTDGSDKLLFHGYDESINKYIGRKYNMALTVYQNIWTHLVATYDGGVTSTGVKLYLNGVNVDDATDESATLVAIENLTHATWIGRYDTSYANGLIDNVMVFNKELTLLEVKLLYNNGAGVENLPTLIGMSRTGQHFSSHQIN